MEIIHAIWEKRNMGVDCYEVNIEEGDSQEMFVEKKHEFETDYTVVKVQSDNVEYGLFLQEQGYKYIETMILFKTNAKLPNVNALQKRMLDNMSYMEMPENEKNYLFEQIRGGMFTTDRIYKDPVFSKQQASERYIGMLNDEIERGCMLYSIYYKDKYVGFFSLRNKGNGVFNPPLAGIFQDVKLPGVGISMDYFEIMETMKSGGNKVYASVSTNNRGAFTIPIMLGYSIEKMENVYIKHRKDLILDGKNN